MLAVIIKRTLVDRGEDIEAPHPLQPVAQIRQHELDQSFRIGTLRIFDWTNAALRIVAEFGTYITARHGDRSQEQSDQRKVQKARVSVKGKSKPVEAWDVGADGRSAT